MSNQTNMKTPLWMALTVFLASLVPGLTAAEGDWQVVNVDGREYLTLENVADFYQLGMEPDTAAQRVVLSDAHVRIETMSNPREISVNGVKQWLCFPLLVRDGAFLISRFDLAKTIDPCLRPTMIGNLEPFHTIVLDAGHGGQDGGGHTTSGYEKDYTLDVIHDVKNSLEAKGFHVVLTRDTDNYLSLEQRAEMANAVSDAIFVSVHFNSGEAEASGLEVYAMTPQGASSTSDTRPALDQLLPMPGNDFDNASLALANCVHHAVLGTLGVSDRGVKRARFAVLKLTHAPSILIEGGFMTNGADSREIVDPTWRKKLAEAIVGGVRSYSDLVQFKQSPKLLADYRAEQPSVPRTVTNVAFRPLMPRLDSRLASNYKPTPREQPSARMITVPARKR